VGELCEFVKGPDFRRTLKSSRRALKLLAMYETGNGSVRMRARYEIEDGCVVITALPHQTSAQKSLSRSRSR